MTKDQLESENLELKFELYRLRDYENKWVAFTNALENIIQEKIYDNDR